MTAKNIEQYVTLKKKAELSTEETAVVDAFDKAFAAEDAAITAAPAVAAVTEANDVLEDAQEALVATPSTTV